MKAHPGPMPRREFLTWSSLALGGVGLSQVLPVPATARESATSSPDTSVILLWLGGGPPHMDTYDLKPDAPVEYRGAFTPIPTNVPGLDICELLPLHARVADKFAIIRSISHPYSEHGCGCKHVLTGREPGAAENTIHPMVGSLVAKCREKVRLGVPNYIAPRVISNAGTGTAYYGTAAAPFSYDGDPSKANFEVPNLAPDKEIAGQFPDRLALLNSLDRLPVASDPASPLAGVEIARGRALDLLQGQLARRAFDIKAEPAAVRERYGMNVWGQRCLLARRLVEHGASFVTVSMEGGPLGGNWDFHAINAHVFDIQTKVLPEYDRCVSALIEDIYSRGLDKKVMLIATGEFGRTPRITYNAPSPGRPMRPGRDHWSAAMSVLVSGGGLQVGQAVGSTNARGEYPQERRLILNDLWATMFHHLGIDYANTYFPDGRGRPMAILPTGEPIKELV